MNHLLTEIELIDSGITIRIEVDSTKEQDFVLAFISFCDHLMTPSGTRDISIESYLHPLVFG
jgi:hypothetical protein